jgi:hypothetical protein
MIQVEPKPLIRLRQGDIFRNIEYIEDISEKDGIIEVSRIIFPLVIILTQDCDLEQEHDAELKRKELPIEEQKNHDKALFSVLVAPLYNVEHFYEGKHLSNLRLQMQVVNKSKSPGTNLRNNQNPRYHYLEFPEDIPIVSSVIDFKHYFSVNTLHLKNLKNERFVCSVSPLYREDISHRFASYLSRIGLPTIQG